MAPTHLSYEDYVAMAGCVPVLGFEGTLAHFKLTMAQWTQIAGHWNGIIAANPQYMQHGMRVEQEAARIRAGGAPRPVSIGGAAAPAAAGDGFPVPADPSMHAVSGAMPGAVPVPAGYGAAPAPAYRAPVQQAWPQQQPHPGYQQHAYNQQAVHFGNQVGNAFSAFGNAMGSLVNSAVGTFMPGTAVMVRWSDGNHYPATVTLSQSGQVQVAFPDGRQVWVPQQYVVAR